MSEVVGEFAWPSSKSPQSKCRVVIKQGRHPDGRQRVYVLSVIDGVESALATFQRSELPDIIAALEKARDSSIW